MGGHWCEYHMYSVWQADVSSMFFSCHFDMKVPEARRLEVCDLLAHANERLWLGHFDLMAEEGAVMFRHTIQLRGLTGASVEQPEELVEDGIVAGDGTYPALQMDTWGGHPMRDPPDAPAHETLRAA